MPRLDTPPDPAPELPAGEVAAADGFTALRGATIRGRKLPIRRERG